MPTAVSEGMQRVRELAIRDSKMQFTSLLHHATPEFFAAVFSDMRHKPSSRFDKKVWHAYREEHLHEKLENLRKQVFDGVYRPRLVQKALQKQSGKETSGKNTSPLYFAHIEDMIVQHVIRMIIAPLYETIFCIPGQEDAIVDTFYDSLSLVSHTLNYVLITGIKGWLGAFPSDTLLSFMKLRIGDPRILNLIAKWLRSGILEHEFVEYFLKGRLPRAAISPLLINIYLHYVFDAWADQWRKDVAKGDVSVVRLAQDLIIAFQYKEDALRFWEELNLRFTTFTLELSSEKSRLIEFGEFPKSK